MGKGRNSLNTTAMGHFLFSFFLQKLNVNTTCICSKRSPGSLKIIIHLTENTDDKGVIALKSGCSGEKKGKKKNF